MAVKERIVEKKVGETDNVGRGTRGTKVTTYHNNYYLSGSQTRPNNQTIFELSRVGRVSLVHATHALLPSLSLPFTCLPDGLQRSWPSRFRPSLMVLPRLRSSLPANMIHSATGMSSNPKYSSVPSASPLGQLWLVQPLLDVSGSPTRHWSRTGVLLVFEHRHSYA